MIANESFRIKYDAMHCGLSLFQGAKRRGDDGRGKGSSESQANSYQSHPWHTMVHTPHHSPLNVSSLLSCNRCNLFSLPPFHLRCVVWTGDDRVFFYNPTTRLSMWDRPEELVGRADVDKHIQEPPHKRGLEDSKKTGVNMEPVTVILYTALVIFVLGCWH